MKLLLAPLFAYAVGAFPSNNVDHGRSLLSTVTPQLEVGYGTHAHNSLVSAADLESAAEAANNVYEWGPGQCSGKKHGDWTCVKCEEVSYPYWFGEDSAFIRFHFFKAPNNKCGFVFRGTENKQPTEWWTNVNFMTKEPSWWFMGEHIHKGYKDAFDGFTETYWTTETIGGVEVPVPKERWVGGQVKGKFTWYLNHYKDDCKNGVFFVGHSLGGALATTADIWYAQTYGIDKASQGYPAEAVSITFGAPMIMKQKSNKRRANELRIIHERDPVSGTFGGFMSGGVFFEDWSKHLEHRGPAKVIKCRPSTVGGSVPPSSETCAKIEIVDGNDQTYSVSGSTNYHSMENYLKYVKAEREPKKLLTSRCSKHEQCHSNWCSIALSAVGYRTCIAYDSYQACVERTQAPVSCSSFGR